MEQNHSVWGVIPLLMPWYKRDGGCLQRHRVKWTNSAASEQTTVTTFLSFNVFSIVTDNNSNMLIKWYRVPSRQPSRSLHVYAALNVRGLVRVVHLSAKLTEETDAQLCFNKLRPPL